MGGGHQGFLVTFIQTFTEDSGTTLPLLTDPHRPSQTLIKPSFWWEYNILKSLHLNCIFFTCVVIWFIGFLRFYFFLTNISASFLV